MRVLVVCEPFGEYAKGHIIRDPAEITKVQEAGQAHFCTPADHPEEFFAAPAADQKAKG